MSEEPALKRIKVEDLMLDVQNPRFLHLRQDGRHLTQEEIEDDMFRNDDDLQLLTKSIMRSGVKDPIWVIPRDGKYLVVEGNRRTVVLRRLLKEQTQPPSGIRYDEVDAHVLPGNTPEVEVILQKARLQSGKKAWGAFNEAALTFMLREFPYLMAFEDIAVELKIPIKKAKERVENYKLFTEYVRATGDDNPRRFAYFAECPEKVKEWIRESPKNKEEYFKLINPLKGENRIKAVATSGGLRDFAKILESPKTLKLFLNEPTMSVEEALDMLKQEDITRAMPFIKRLMPLVQELRHIDESQLERLKAEPQFKMGIKALQRVCDEILGKLR
jgi:hypothetical protein